MKHIPEKEKHLFYSNWDQTEQILYMQFGAVTDIYISNKQKKTFNVNLWNLYNSIADYAHKMHLNISCHSVSQNNMVIRWYLGGLDLQSMFCSFNMGANIWCKAIPPWLWDVQINVAQKPNVSYLTLNLTWFKKCIWIVSFHLEILL